MCHSAEFQHVHAWPITRCDKFSSDPSHSSRLNVWYVLNPCTPECKELRGEKCWSTLLKGIRSCSASAPVWATPPRRTHLNRNQMRAHQAFLCVSALSMPKSVGVWLPQRPCLRCWCARTLGKPLNFCAIHLSPRTTGQANCAGKARPGQVGGGVDVDVSRRQQEWSDSTRGE